MRLSFPAWARHLALVVVSFGIIALTPVKTSLDNHHMAVMAAGLLSALFLPYVVSRWVFKENVISFRLHHGRSWYKKEVLYVGVAGVLGYFLIPFYLKNTGAYANWTVGLDTSSLIKLLIGVVALAIWDEMFFVCTLLALLRQHLPFWVANGLQALVFNLFLFKLAFTGWAPLPLVPFALIQGYIFNKTESLLYVVTIHLTLDAVLFLALIHAHFPPVLNIFVTAHS